MSRMYEDVAIFADTGSIAEIRQWAAHPAVSGITTNPSLVRSAGVRDYRAFCTAVIEEFPDVRISFEVLSEDFAEIEAQANWLASLSEHVSVKVPVRTTSGSSTVPVLRALASAGVRTNVTAMFTVDECQQACEAVAHGPRAIMSLFAGRLADIGEDPEPVARRCSEICADAGASMLWAGVREVFNVVQARRSGCDIITLTPPFLEKLDRLSMPVAAMSASTVQMLVDAGRGLTF